jgi:hypothetical protein
LQHLIDQDHVRLMAGDVLRQHGTVAGGIGCQPGIGLRIEALVLAPKYDAGRDSERGDAAHPGPLHGTSERMTDRKVGGQFEDFRMRFDRPAASMPAVMAIWCPKLRVSLS